jgi:hypothetical protein
VSCQTVVLNDPQPSCPVVAVVQHSRRPFALPFLQHCHFHLLGQLSVISFSLMAKQHLLFFSWILSPALLKKKNNAMLQNSRIEPAFHQSFILTHKNISQCLFYILDRIKRQKNLTLLSLYEVHYFLGTRRTLCTPAMDTTTTDTDFVLSSPR